MTDLKCGFAASGILGIETLARGLSHHLHEQHTGDHRKAGKVIGKELFARRQGGGCPYICPATSPEFRQQE